MIVPAYLLLALVVLCVLVRITVPHRRRVQRVVVGASLGGWVGSCVPLFYDVNRVAELVRRTELYAPSAHALLQGLGFSGSHNEWAWFWNALVLVGGLALLGGVLAYWSAPRAGIRPGWGMATLLVVVAGRVLYSAHQPPTPAAVRSPWPRPVRVTLRQPGLLPYPLGGAQVEHARYDSVSMLALSGTLPRGETLHVRFLASALAAPHTTNLVEVRVRGQRAAQAFGHSTYDRATNTFTGQFHCLLPSGQLLRGSFAHVGLPAVP